MIREGKPRLLDLFCGAGGAAMGYHRAGFAVVGVDIDPQPRFPFEFHQADALTFPLAGFDAYHASPPCQPWVSLRKLNIHQGVARDYPELIAPIRQRLQETGCHYIIENAPGAPLHHPITLCGSSFGLHVRRHRAFEATFAMLRPPCAHYNYVRDKPALHRHQGKHSSVVGCYGTGRGKGDTRDLWARAMGITWMTKAELAQAIPPAYTEYIGRHLMTAIMTARKGVA